jgi:hypothetical protein
MMRRRGLKRARAWVVSGSKSKSMFWSESGVWSRALPGYGAMSRSVSGSVPRSRSVSGSSDVSESGSMSWSKSKSGN